MVPSVLVRCSRNKPCAARILTATFSSPSKPPLAKNDAKRNDPASSHQERSSYGVNYLETWMGTQKRRPLAPAGALPTVVPCNVVSSADNDRAQLADPITHHQLPISSYQLYTLRPSLTTDPKTLMQSLKNSIVRTDPNIVPRTVPIVLDMSAFWLPHYSPPPEGTMKNIVNAIISHANENKSNVKF